MPRRPAQRGVTHLHRRRVPEANLRDGAKIGRGGSHLVLYPFMCECVGARGCCTAFSSQNCVVTFPAGGGGMVWQGERGERGEKLEMRESSGHRCVSVPFSSCIFMYQETHETCCPGGDVYLCTITFGVCWCTTYHYSPLLWVVSCMGD